MKPKHVEAYRVAARATLASLNIGLGQDYATLTTAQIEDLLIEADRRRYQKPAHTNGSRGRYFHALLQREAQRKEK